MWNSVFDLLLLAASVFSFSLSKSLPSTTDSMTVDMSSLNYMDDELQKLKDLMRSRAPSINSLTRLNVTLGVKRKLVRQYRQKLLELNELSTDAPEQIHRRDYHSYTAMADGQEDLKRLSFPVDLEHPTDHRVETKVQSATLKLYRKKLAKESQLLLPGVTPSLRNIGYNAVLLVFQTLPGGMRRLVTSSVISLAKSGVINIDITEIVQNWVDEPTMNYGIEIESPSHNISQLLSHSIDDVTSDHRATLDIYTYEKSINTVRRSRRDVGEDTCEPGRCCRLPVNITLAEVGHHIEGLHEEGEYITAYLCSGRCPRNYKLHNSWSNIKNAIRLRNRQTQLRNRCAPTAYEKTFSLLSIDHMTGMISFVEYDDLIVKQCGCV